MTYKLTQGHIDIWALGHFFIVLFNRKIFKGISNTYLEIGKGERKSYILRTLN